MGQVLDSSFTKLKLIYVFTKAQNHSKTYTLLNVGELTDLCQFGGDIKTELEMWTASCSSENWRLCAKGSV